jgi:hypothetical protein
MRGPQAGRAHQDQVLDQHDQNDQADRQEIGPPHHPGHDQAQHQVRPGQGARVAAQGQAAA